MIKKPIDIGNDWHINYKAIAGTRFQSLGRELNKPTDPGTGSTILLNALNVTKKFSNSSTLTLGGQIVDFDYGRNTPDKAGINEKDIMVFGEFRTKTANDIDVLIYGEHTGTTRCEKDGPCTKTFLARLTGPVSISKNNVHWVAATGLINNDKALNLGLIWQMTDKIGTSVIAGQNFDKDQTHLQLGLNYRF